MPKRKGVYRSPPTSSKTPRSGRPRQRMRFNNQASYQITGRSLPPMPGVQEFGRSATARFNESIAADVLSGMAAVAASEATGVPAPLIGMGLRVARNALFNSGVVAQEKTMGTTTKAKKVLVNRSSMSVAGKTKVKRVKKVHLSDKFVKGVKQVMAGAASTGTYITIKQGMVGSIVSPTNGTLTVVDLGLGAQNAILTPGQGSASGSRTLFNCLSQFSTSSNTTAVAETGFNYFTPAKILDAASVLFNGKALGDPYIQTDNLATTSVGGTGAPVPSVPGQLKINVLGSSVDFELKNVSNRTVTMEIWECTPTLKFQLANPLALVQSQCIAYLEPLNNNNMLYFQAGATTNALLYEQAVDPLAVLKKYAGLPMTWKKRTMILAPDETCIHSIIGPSGVLDFSKLSNSTAAAPLASSSPQLNCLLKGWSVGCIISVSGDQVIQPTLPGARGDKAAYSDGVNTRMGMPISMQIREYYRIAVPEVAGFITRAGAVGSVQQLNLRKPKIIIRNLVPVNGATNVNLIQVSNEANPVAETTTAQQT